MIVLGVLNDFCKNSISWDLLPIILEHLLTVNITGLILANQLKYLKAALPSWDQNIP